MSNKNNTIFPPTTTHKVNYTGLALDHKLYDPVMKVNNGNTKISTALSVEGDAEIKGKLKVDGLDIGQSLRRIESRLAILRTSPELEAQFDELRVLGDQYREAEKKFLEQMQIWKTLSDPDDAA